MKAQLLLSLLLLAACGAPERHDEAATAPTSGTVKAAAKWHCPMHPTFVKDGPGPCAICGMNLVPIEGAGTAGGTEVEGRTTIMVRPERQQQVGVATVVLTNSTVERTIRAPAAFEADPGRVRKIAPRFGGYIEELFVTAPGTAVTNGQPLARVFSTDAQSTRAELALAVRNGATDLVTAIRGRLEAMGLDDSSDGSAHVILRAPFAAVATEIPARTGQAFEPGESLMELTDLSRLWVRASLFPADQRLISIGQHAVVESAAGPLISAPVTAFFPTIDPESRTVQVRLEVANPDGALRPGQWAVAEFEHDLGEHLTVPASAVIDTGTRLVAFVQTAPDTFEPRAVEVTDRGGDDWIVAAGLKAGDRVVTRALFLLDSESQLKAAILGQTAGGPKHE